MQFSPAWETLRLDKSRQTPRFRPKQFQGLRRKYKNPGTLDYIPPENLSITDMDPHVYILNEGTR